MIYIRKKPEPRSLTEYKLQPFANYDGCDKEPIRQSLFEEQGHLCAYWTVEQGTVLRLMVIF